MPVRTRSQRAKQAQMSASSMSREGEENIHHSSGKRKNVRFANTQKQSLLSTSQDQKSQEHSPQMQGEASPPMLSFPTPNSDEIRQYVQNILNSPHKVYSSKDPEKVPTTPPRVGRITLENDDMEFLIPPKQSETPFEIRRRIRRVLSPEPIPHLLQEQYDRASAEPVLDPKTGLWSPTAPDFDNKKADRVSRFLFVFIFTVLLAVFVAVFHDEILFFLQNNIVPLGQQLGQQLKQRSETLVVYLEAQFEWIKEAMTTWMQKQASPAESAVMNDGMTDNIIHDAVTK